MASWRLFGYSGASSAPCVQGQERQPGSGEQLSGENFHSLGAEDSEALDAFGGLMPVGVIGRARYQLS